MNNLFHELNAAEQMALNAGKHVAVRINETVPIPPPQKDSFWAKLVAASSDIANAYQQSSQYTYGYGDR